jgi:hypothetical protein
MKMATRKSLEKVAAAGSTMIQDAAYCINFTRGKNGHVDKRLAAAMMQRHFSVTPEVAHECIRMVVEQANDIDWKERGKQGG